MPATTRMLEYGTAALLGATIVAFATGSASVPEVVAEGHRLRWAVLVVFAAVALVWACVEERAARRPFDRWLYGLPLALLGLAALSAGWSIVPRTTIGRTASVALAVLAAACTARATRDRADRLRLVAASIVVGALVVTLLGLVVVAVDRQAAVQEAYPPRFRGLGENVNTVSLLAAVAVPLAVMLALGVRNRRARLGWAAAAVALVAMVDASGSRGALLGSMIGVFLYGIARPGPAVRRLAVGIGLALVVAVGAEIATKVSDRFNPVPPAATPPAVTTTTTTTRTTPTGTTPTGTTPGQQPTRIPPNAVLPPAPPLNHLTSGRMEAWIGAVERADRRPVLGYGFGSEETAFIDRYHDFAGGHVENSYVGMYLQLGALGTALFLAFGFLALGRGIRGWRRLGPAERDLAAGFTASFVTAGFTALVLSYLYSVGNIAMVTVTVCAFVCGSLGSAARA